MIKICFFSGDITRNGGTERVSITIANELAKDDAYEVCFLSLVEQKEKPCYDIDPRIKRSALGKKWLSPGPAYLPLIPKVRKLLKTNKIDLIIDIDIVLDVLSVPAAMGLKTKVLSWEHSNCAYELGIGYRRVILNLFTKRSDQIVTLTPGDAKAFQEHMKRTDRITSIYNPASLPIQSEAERENWLITAARLVPGKGFDLLLQVAKKVLPNHPDWKWMLCGEGPEREMIESFCEKEGLHDQVVLLGYVPRVEDYLVRSKIFVLTSRAEGLPMCLLEARSCGVPCVSFDIPTGPADMIEDGVNGYLIPPFDVDLMATRLETMMTDQERFEAMQKQAPQRMECFQLSAVSTQWKELIGRLLE
ncbi:MAG: glycosyltransferase family 4 protein [Lachnospiraceae bacterium]|nr:glycosyltransferase family 4 protein [Lachnospiraceae bacterium]